MRTGVVETSLRGLGTRPRRCSTARPAFRLSGEPRSPRLASRLHPPRHDPQRSLVHPCRGKARAGLGNTLFPRAGRRGDRPQLRGGRRHNQVRAPGRPCPFLFLWPAGLTGPPFARRFVGRSRATPPCVESVRRRPPTSWLGPWLRRITGDDPCSTGSGTAAVCSIAGPGFVQFHGVAL